MTACSNEFVYFRRPKLVVVWIISFKICVQYSHFCMKRVKYRAKCYRTFPFNLDFKKNRTREIMKKLIIKMINGVNYILIPFYRFATNRNPTWAELMGKYSSKGKWQRLHMKFHLSLFQVFPSPHLENISVLWNVDFCLNNTNKSINRKMKVPTTGACFI